MNYFLLYIFTTLLLQYVSLSKIAKTSVQDNYSLGSPGTFWMRQFTTKILKALLADLTWKGNNPSVNWSEEQNACSKGTKEVGSWQVPVTKPTKNVRNTSHSAEWSISLCHQQNLKLLWPLEYFIMLISANLFLKTIIEA